MWFPPVQIGDETYIDAIFHLPTNLEEAIRRGADELWVICAQWKTGFTGNFFSLFEAVTNHRYKEMLARIVRNNEAVPRDHRPRTARRGAAALSVQFLAEAHRGGGGAGG